MAESLMHQPEDLLIEMFQSGFQRRIQTFGQKKPETLAQIIQQIYGEKATSQSLETLVKQAQDAQFPLPADLRFVPYEDISAYAAYHPGEGGVVLFDQALLERPELLQNLYTEEVGHHLDVVLKGDDTPGDEGFLFRLALDKEAPLTASELALGRSIDDQSHTPEGDPIELQALPAPVMVHYQTLFNLLETPWYQWHVPPEELNNAMQGLASLRAAERLELINRLFVQDPSKALFWMQELKHTCPEQLPAFLNWMSQPDTLLPLTLRQFQKMLPRLHRYFYHELKQALSSRLFQQTDLEATLQTLDGLPMQDRSAVLSLLMIEAPTQTQTLFQDHATLGEIYLPWWANLTPRTKHAFMGQVTSESYSAFLSAFNRLSDPEQKVVIAGYGPQNWVAKIFLEWLGAMKNHHEHHVTQFLSAFQYCTENLFPDEDWTDYAALIQDFDAENCQLALGSLADEDHRLHRSGKSDAFRLFKRRGIDEPMRIIERMRLAYALE